MEKKLKVLLDAEITDDKINTELQNGSGRIRYSYQACQACGGGRYLEE